jgi:hypothetical protein
MECADKIPGRLYQRCVGFLRCRISTRNFVVLMVTGRIRDMESRGGVMLLMKPY